MMDTTFQAVCRLYEQKLTIAEIAARLHLSDGKTKKILITAGLYTDSRVEYVAREYKAGKSIDEIAASLGIGRNAAFVLLPYTRCMYNAEYPTKNALTIRRFRERAAQREKALKENSPSAT